MSARHSSASCLRALAWNADWLTDGGSSQRTAYQQDETSLTPANVGNRKLLWKLKLDNQPRVMHSLFPPLIIERLNTPEGPRQVAIEAGSSDNIYAIDVEKAKSSGRNISRAPSFHPQMAEAGLEFSVPEARRLLR